ncbi:MAG: hypothetical protein WBG73_13930 [Coleofasciculaceae cyanobacterium]
MAALPGFDLKSHGFSFENYGDTEPNLQLPLYIKNSPTPTNLTSEDVKRMFGDQVCGSNADGECTLTPPYQKWMEEHNTSMNGGHCDGMAALSLLLYGDIKGKRSEFGGQNAYALKITENQKLQREIAYWFSTQNTQPTRNSVLKITPMDVITKLKESFQAVKEGKASELYTMSIYSREMKGGHAITPYAVKDLGDEQYEILVYDSNIPEKPQAVKVDGNTNTWKYDIWEDIEYDLGGGSTLPIPKNLYKGIYEGDAQTKTLRLKNAIKRLVTPQECDFCLNDQNTALKTTGQKSNQIKYNQIWKEGEGELLITDSQGRRFGYVNGKLVEEIPGVEMDTIQTAEPWEDISPQIYYVPLGIQFSLTIDGSNVKNETETAITMFGPGYDLGIEEIKLDPGQKDTLTLSPDGQTLTYKTNGNESPTIDIGFESAGPDYGFSLKGVDLDGGGVINVNLDKTKGVLSFDTKQNQKPGTYALLMERINDQGEQTFYHDNIRLNPNDIASLDYKKWSGEGGVLQLKIDRGGQGSTIDTIELTDEEEKA